VPAARCRRLPRRRALLVLAFWQAEEQQAAEAETSGLFGFLDRLVDGEIEDAGHGADGGADALSGADEERVNQVAGFEGGLADQGAQRIVAAQAAHADVREGHASILAPDR